MLWCILGPVFRVVAVCCNILVAVVLFLMLCYWHLYVVFLLYDTIPAAVCFFVTLGLYNFMCCTIMS